MVDMNLMTGVELDRRMREILLNATRETALSSTAALCELGFSPRAAFEVIEKTIIAKEKR